MTGPPSVAGRSATGRCGRQQRTPKPTLQGSFAGAGIVSLFLQEDANQPTAPSGVLLPHLDGLLKGVAVRGQLVGGTVSIIGFDPALPTPGKTTYQVLHRAYGEFEFLGKNGHRFALSPTFKDHLPNRQWNRSRHRSSSMNYVKSNAALL